MCQMQQHIRQSIKSHIELSYTMHGFNGGKHVRKFIGKSKEQASTLLRKLISPSMRFKLRNTVASLREHLGRACLWQWEFARFPTHGNNQFDLLYAGRKARRESANALVRLDGAVNANHNGTAQTGRLAHQIELGEVRTIAQKVGRLDLVLLGDEVVACNLGCEFAGERKRYWSTIRFGYPKEAFSNSKQLSETNAISFYLALEWAVKNNFDYYDLGICLGRPEDTLLQWKNRWGEHSA